MGRAVTWPPTCFSSSEGARPDEDVEIPRFWRVYQTMQNDDAACTSMFMAFPIEGV